MQRLIGLPAIALGLCFGLAAVPSSAAEPDPDTAGWQQAIDSFIEEMAGKHQFSAAALRWVFAQVKPRPGIIRAMTAPATARPWYEFRAAHVNRSLIEGGVSFWRRHAAALARARREYGVPEEIVVATIGIETRYGRHTGSFRVLDALATLAFQHPPRAEFFRRELEEYLLLARESGFDPLGVRGSYAGAIGIPQFLPSSYRAYAVDFDRDGKRDLVASAADAIGSVAHYYHRFGWKEGEAATVPASVGGDLDTAGAGTIRPDTPVGELRRRGITPLAPLPDDALAAFFTVEGESGPEYWIGLNNFYVVTRYNRSINYAMAVLELAGELHAAMRRPGPAPRPRTPEGARRSGETPGEGSAAPGPAPGPPRGSYCRAKATRWSSSSRMPIRSPMAWL